MGHGEAPWEETKVVRSIMRRGRMTLGMFLKNINNIDFIFNSLTILRY
jgi:hypothetical protein